MQKLLSNPGSCEVRVATPQPQVQSLQSSEAAFRAPTLFRGGPTVLLPRLRLRETSRAADAPMKQAAFCPPCVVAGGTAFVRGGTDVRRSGVARSTARRSARGRVAIQPRADATSPMPEDTAREEQAKKVEKMRSRLEGLFGAAEDNVRTDVSDEFDGAALRSAVRERWGVQYDVQPQKRHGRVYVQVRFSFEELKPIVWILGERGSIRPDFLACKADRLLLNENDLRVSCRLCGDILNSRAFTWRKTSLPVIARLLHSC